MIGPIRIKPIIKIDNENNFEITIILLFSLPNIFDMYIHVTKKAIQVMSK